MTGWLPERISLSEYNKENFFRLISRRYTAGDALITFATGDISDFESERTGLVSTHAYAMLDAKCVNVIFSNKIHSEIHLTLKFSYRIKDCFY